MRAEDVRATESRRARIEGRLADRVICDRCRCTLDTYADACTARLDDPCPGFLAIEAAIQQEN